MVHCRAPESEGINATLSLSGINPGIVHLLPRSAWALYDRRDLFKSTLVLVSRIRRRGYCPCSFIAAPVFTTEELVWVCVCVILSLWSRVLYLRLLQQQREDCNPGKIGECNVLFNQEETWFLIFNCEFDWILGHGYMFNQQPDFLLLLLLLLLGLSCFVASLIQWGATAATLLKKILSETCKTLPQNTPGSVCRRMSSLRSDMWDFNWI